METNTQLLKKIEAILYYLTEPVSYSYLAKILEITEEEVILGIENLSEILRDRGVCLVKHNDTVTLTTTAEMSEIIEKVIKDERERDLGRASIETLAIIAYKGPVGRKEIEYIRGVNCQFALRTLLLRGLIEKKNKEGDERAFVYNITVDAIMHLGLQNISELPEYDNMKKQMEVVEEKIVGEIEED